jgi:uncharacterized membrane protein
MKKALLVLTVVLMLAAAGNEVSALPNAQITVKNPSGAVTGTETNPVSKCPGPILNYPICGPTGCTGDVQIFVKNMGTSSDTYQLSMTLPQGWTGSIQPDIALASGEESPLYYFYVNIPATALPGKYRITIQAKSMSNSADVAKKEVLVDVLACHIVELKTVDNYKETCQESAGTSTYGLQVTNRGKWTESFRLSSTTDWVRFSQTEIELNSGETKNIQLIAEPPATLSGTQDIHVTVKSTQAGSYAQDDDVVQLKLNNCYDFKIDVQPSENSVCLTKSVSYKLTISNTGQKTDTYQITAPQWVTPGQAEIEVPTGQARQVDVHVRPTHAGRSAFNVNVLSLNESGNMKSVERYVLAEECRGVALIPSPDVLTACKGTIATFNIAIKNTGTIEETFEVKASVGSLEAESVTLPGGESRSIDLNIDTKELEIGNQTVLVEVGDDVVSDQSELELVIEDCYGLSFAVVVTNEDKICPGIDVPFEVTVENNGKLADLYTLEYDDVKEEFQLESGGLKRFNFSLPVPEDKTEYNVSIKAYSEHMSKSMDIPLKVNSIQDCYSVELSTLDGPTPIEMGIATAVPIKVKNTGLQPDEYEISIQGPSWVFMSPNKLALGRQQEGVAYLYVSPPFGIEEGSYTALISFTSAKTQSDITFNIDVSEQGVMLQNTSVTMPGPSTEPGSITINVSFGDNITGAVTADERPLWKTLTVAAITIVILLILIVRFAFLFRK